MIAPLESIEILLPLVKDNTEPVGTFIPPLTTAIALTINEPVIVWEPLNEFEPVVANEPVFIVVEELTNPNAVICAHQILIWNGLNGELALM